MINPYEIDKDPQFRKFFKHLLTPEEIMKSDDIPCDNTHLEAIENAKRAYQGDIDMVLESINQTITEKDIELLFTTPVSFGYRTQEKVLDYIQSKVESEFNE